MVADTVGASVLAFNRRGTGSRAFIDLGAKRALKPARVHMTHAQTADSLLAAGVKDDYPTLVGWGDSGSGELIMGMQLTTRLFGRLLLRDCFNHAAPQGPVEGIRNFIRYTTHGELEKVADPQAPQVPAVPQGRGGSIARQLVEIYNYSALMRSDHTLEAAHMLAADHPELPMRIVGFAHSFTGTHEQTTAFHTELLAERVQVANLIHGIDDEASVGDVYTSIANGYHSDLLRPDHAAHHLEQTLALHPLPERH